MLTLENSTAAAIFRALSSFEHGHTMAKAILEGAEAFDLETGKDGKKKGFAIVMNGYPFDPMARPGTEPVLRIRPNQGTGRELPPAPQAATSPPATPSARPARTTPPVDPMSGTVLEDMSNYGDVDGPTGW